MCFYSGNSFLFSVPVLLVVITFCVIGQTEGQYEAKTINGVKVTPAMLYNDCDQRDKRCFGDTENCLSSRNCTFAAAISENRTHFTILMLDNCADPEDKRHHYFAVGLTTLDSHRNQVCRDPTFEDFKIFMLWDPVKCEKRNMYAYKMYWTWRNKSNWRQNCDYAESINGTKKEGEFNLAKYFKSNIFPIGSGERVAPDFAAHVDYKIINNDAIQYINRHAPVTEPRDVGFERENNRVPGDAASQSDTDSDSSESSSNSITTGPLMHIIFTFATFYSFLAVIL